MKLILQYTTFIVIATLLLSNRGGRNAPSTGAPFDNGGNCAQCHSGGNFNVTPSLSITDANGAVISGYKPGSTYDITISPNIVSGGNPNSYGFQLVVVDTTKSEQAGTFTSLGTNVRKSTFDNREYVMQSNRRPDGTFNMKWTAPTQGVGGLKMYISYLSVNGNGNTNGDKNTTAAFDINQDITSNVEVLDKNYTVFPNPTNGFLYFGENQSEVIVSNQLGQIVRTYKDVDFIDITYLQVGLYFIKTPHGIKCIIKE